MIHAAKGKKLLKFEAPSAKNRDEILKVVMGPSGNLRAPTYRIADQFIVGYSEELYREIFASS